ncbi:MAG TPA: HAMP domain-containing sensor histidine kinase, partial [Vicinamibacteria bacterium]|nr:HAMP domain-containing sensor histidine kinase [Vicinamibacteria bacterium]
MTTTHVRELFFPQDELDTEFRTALECLSLTGLRIASGIAIGGSLLVVLMGLLGVPGMSQLFTLERGLPTLALAFVPFGLSFVPSLQPYYRLIGALAGFLVSLEAIFGLMSTVPDPVHAAHLAAIKVTAVMLVAIAAFPMRPLQVLVMGLGITGAMMAVLQRVEQGAIAVVSVFIVTLICTLLATILYRQRASAYRARRKAEKAFEELRSAQARLVVAENARSLGRFAAALSHEFNSPLGALRSSMDTLVSLIGKAGHKVPPDQLEEVATGVAETARQSLRRLTDTIDRIKHFTNLDRAEIQMVNLNELWVDTVALLGGELGGRAGVKLDLKPLPPLKCRPQQLSAVFSNLLRNAAAATDARGTIKITTANRGSHVVLEVHDDGKGIPVERLPYLFDPAFRPEGARVGTGWGLF